MLMQSGIKQTVCLTRPYSCKESDHQFAADMHSLLCNVTRICSICNVASCTASGMHMKSFPGNFRGLDLMTSVKYGMKSCITMFPSHVNWLRKHRYGTMSISPNHCLVVYLHQMEPESITSWRHCFWFPGL